MANKRLGNFETKERWMEAANRIVQQEGVKALSIRRVAREAGYTSAALYKHFSSFAQLIAHASLSFDEEIIAAIWEARRQAATPLEEWAAGYQGMAAYYVEHPFVFECLFVAGYDNEVIKEMRACRKQAPLALFTKREMESLAKRMGLALHQVWDLHQICFGLCVGNVLLFNQGRTYFTQQEMLEKLKDQIRNLLKNATLAAGEERSMP